MLTFISGGVRSGKSAYAEKRLVEQANSSGGRLIYIASGQATDDEMRERIAKHRHDRADAGWLTFEQPIAIAELLPHIQPGDYVLWDCLTTWLANEMYTTNQDGIFCVNVPGCMERKCSEVVAAVGNMREIATHVTIVSNEVLDELPSPYEETKRYSQLLGDLHCKFVQIADNAIEMDYGFAIEWKKEGQVCVQ